MIMKINCIMIFTVGPHCHGILTLLYVEASLVPALRIALLCYQIKRIVQTTK